MTKPTWQKIDYADPSTFPPNGEPVLTKVDDENGVRNEQVLIRDNNLYFFEDGSMYVYYAPTHWREIGNIHDLEGPK